MQMTKSHWVCQSKGICSMNTYIVFLHLQEDPHYKCVLNARAADEYMADNSSSGQTPSKGI